MHLGLSTRIAKRAMKPALAGLLAGLVLFAAIASASPAIHEQFHHDPSTPSHGCAICLFALGQLGATEVSAAAVMLAGLLCFSVNPLSAVFSSSIDYRLSPSRAPPRN